MIDQKFEPLVDGLKTATSYETFQDRLIFSLDKNLKND